MHKPLYLHFLIITSFVFLIFVLIFLTKTTSNKSGNITSFQNLKLKQELTLPLSNPTYALVKTGKNIFALTYASPAELIKIDPNNLNNYKIYPLTFNQGVDMLYDSQRDRLYAILGGRQMCIIEINPQTILTRPIWCIDSHNEKNLPSLTTDGNCLYAISTTKPTVIYKIELSTFKEKGRIVLKDELNYGHSIRYSNGYLYATGENKNGWIAKIDTQSLEYTSNTFSQNIAFPIDDLAITDKHVFVGFENNSGIMTRIDKNTLKIDEIQFSVKANSYGVFFNNDSIWSLLATHPGVIAKTDPLTLKTIYYKLGYDSPNEVVFNDDSMFISFWNKPLKIIKVPLN